MIANQFNNIYVVLILQGATGPMVCITEYKKCFLNKKETKNRKEKPFK